MSRFVVSSSLFRVPAMLAAPALALLVAGCVPAAVKEEVKKQEEAAKNPPPKKESGSIMGKTTQEIGKFDPAANRIVSDSKIRATDPVFGALQAYGPMIEKISKTQIDYQVTIFNVQNERFPTYEEFMSEIIKGGNIQLPVLPAKMEYQYDEANHKLVVVYPEGTEVEPVDGEK